MTADAVTATRPAPSAGRRLTAPRENGSLAQELRKLAAGAGTAVVGSGDGVRVVVGVGVGTGSGKHDTSSTLRAPTPAPTSISRRVILTRVRLPARVDVLRALRASGRQVGSARWGTMNSAGSAAATATTEVAIAAEGSTNTRAPMPMGVTSSETARKVPIMAIARPRSSGPTASEPSAGPSV